MDSLYKKAAAKALIKISQVPEIDCKTIKKYVKDVGFVSLTKDTIKLSINSKQKDVVDDLAKKMSQTAIIQKFHLTPILPSVLRCLYNDRDIPSNKHIVMVHMNEPIMTIEHEDQEDGTVITVDLSEIRDSAYAN